MAVDRSLGRADTRRLQIMDELSQTAGTLVAGVPNARPGTATLSGPGNLDDRMARAVAIKRRARELCTAAGDDPDAIGEPPIEGVATLDHAIPRWVRYQRQAREELENHG